MQLRLLLLCFAGFISSVAAGVENLPLTVTYPRPGSINDVRMQYPLALLKLGFERANMNVTLRASDEVMSQSRALKSLFEQRDVDVVWTMTTNEREADLLPVRIPIFKGLIGWRIALVAADRADQFKSVDDLSTLSLYLAGQGHDWPDTRILRHNQIKVNSVSNYESLFKMLAIHRFDFFPRSVVEIEPELASHPDLDLRIDPYLVLHYPTASYFFFNKQSSALAERFESGLNAAIKDGSFDRLFFHHYREFILPLKLHTRKIINLKNPFLPAATPLTRRELWFDPLQPLPDSVSP